MLKLGIVGLPNVGKSTLFNALTAAGAEAANYPFCTVEPNVGMVEVPDARLAVLLPRLETPNVGQVVDEPPADVVTRPLVLLSWIAESEDDFHRLRIAEAEDDLDWLVVWRGRALPSAPARKERSKHHKED